MESLKVLLVNGSPHKEGCVYTALSEIAGTLKEEDIQSEIFWVGNQPVAGCIGCGACIGKRSCFRKDTVNDFTALIDKYDGFIFGTPVHYAGASGSMTSFMDRVFFIDEFNGEHFAGKPAAAIATCRRSGGTATLDQLNKYMADCNMPIVQDTEGLQIMRVLAKNMAWLLKCIRIGREQGIEFPNHEQHVMMNFIR